MKMVMLKKYARLIYEFGFFQCLKYKFSTRKEKLQGIGLGLFLIQWVHRIGTLWAFPSISSIRLLFILSKKDEYSIVLSHQYGGGAEAYIKRDLGIDNYLLIIPTNAPGRLHCTLFIHSKIKIKFYISSLRVLTHFRYKCHSIIINELVSWWKFTKEQVICNEFYEIFRDIILIKNCLRCKLIYMVHDYFCICPKYTITDHNNMYCASEFSLIKCGNCLTDSNDIPLISSFDIKNWRKEFYILLENCSEIRAFSNDTRERVNKCYPNLTISCHPHQYHPYYKNKPNISSCGLTIGVFGNISQIKGSRQVKGLIDFIQNKSYKNVKVVIVGEIDNVSTNDVCKVLGRYTVEDLPRIVSQEGINIAFFSSVCPETFSYVITELKALELPVVCYNLGAQAERIREYKKGEIIRDYTPEETLATLSKFAYKLGYSNVL